MRDKLCIMGRGLVAVVVSALCFLPVPGSFGQATDSDAGTKSEQRVQLLRTLIEQFLRENGLDTSEFRIIQGVYEQFAKVDDCPLASTELILTRATYTTQAKHLTEDEVAKRFPPLDEEKLKEEAREKFPIYQEGQLVKITYRTSPVRQTTITGVYRGRHGRNIIIGNRSILWEDFASLPENQGELLKFNAPESIQLREEYINKRQAEYQTATEKFRNEVQALFLKAMQTKAVKANEKNGYIDFDGKWLRLRDTMKILIEQTKKRIENEQVAAAKRQIRETDRLIAMSIESQSFFDIIALSVAYQDPETAFAKVYAAELEQQRLDAERKQRAEQLRDKETHVNALLVEARALLEAKAFAEAKSKAMEAQGLIPDHEEAQQLVQQIEGEQAADSRRRREEQEAEEEARLLRERQLADVDTSIPKWVFVLVSVFVLLVGGGGGFLAWKNRTVDPDRFFESKGKVQKSFWQMAESDPQNFKYVAYRFPTTESARDALASLSYIRQVAGGELRCRREILHGLYPHQGKFVSFVGGTNLNYALWREASAVFPELPHAEYFRVSTAPEVTLQIPDIESLLADENLKITFVEQREGEDYSQLHIYQAPNEESAMTFLEKVSVKTEGAHIVVTTPEGTWGKSVAGIYEGYPETGVHHDDDPAEKGANSEVPTAESTAEDKPE